jgi:phage tail sheath protein FI
LVGTEQSLLLLLAGLRHSVEEGHTFWRDGTLSCLTEQEAFYVKCDAETNPPGVRDLGKVVTEIGVAIAPPAEFVIFRISHALPTS